MNQGKKLQATRQAGAWSRRVVVRQVRHSIIEAVEIAAATGGNVLEMLWSEYRFNQAALDVIDNWNR